MQVVLMFPKRSICAAPMNPTSTWPGCMRRPKTSRSPPSITLPGTRQASPMDRGVRLGRASTTPDSNTMMQFGAWVAFASIPPSIGNPVPMNAISRSFSSIAAQIAMSSVSLYSRAGAAGGASVAIVPLPAHPPLRAETREAALPELPEVRLVPVEPVDPLVDPSLPGLEGHAPLRVLLPEGHIDVVVALDLVGVGSERRVDDPIHAESRDDGPVRILPDHLRGHDLLHNHEDPAAREGPPDVVPELAPDLRVPVLVAALGVQDGEVRGASGHEGHPLPAAEGILQDGGLRMAEGFDLHEIRAEHGLHGHEREAHGPREEPHRHREVAVFFDLDGPGNPLLHRATVPVRKAERLEAEVGPLEPPHAAGADEQVRVLRPAAEQEAEVLLPLADDLVREGHGLAHPDAAGPQAAAVGHELSDGFREGQELVVDLGLCHGPQEGATVVKGFRVFSFPEGAEDRREIAEGIDGCVGRRSTEFRGISVS